MLDARFDAHVKLTDERREADQRALRLQADKDNLRIDLLTNSQRDDRADAKDMRRMMNIGLGLALSIPTLLAAVALILSMKK